MLMVYLASCLIFFINIIGWSLNYMGYYESFLTSPYRTHLGLDVNLFFQSSLPCIDTFVLSRKPITKTVLKVFFGKSFDANIQGVQCLIVVGITNPMWLILLVSGRERNHRDLDQVNTMYLDRIRLDFPPEIRPLSKPDEVMDCQYAKSTDGFLSSFVFVR